MQVYDVQLLQAKFADRTAKVDAYFTHRTNLVLNQTVLKLGEYNLTCVPAVLGMTSAQLLAVLTASEVSLFSRFTTGVNTLILVFDAPEAKSAARFHIRVHLASITPVPERKNVCWLAVEFKSVPSELVEILGTFWEEQALRLETYESMGNDEIEVSETEQALLGCSNEAWVVEGNSTWKVGLVRLSTKRAVLELPSDATLPLGKPELHLRLNFKAGPLQVSGSLGTDAVFSLEFSNELLTLLEDYNFRKTLLKKRNAKGEDR
ncbi:MAG: hypothetical protein HKM06_03175 [Spirochaetales bacterium]|nr:hypothetical protein [Spirochaetales bacterium]